MMADIRYLEFDDDPSPSTPPGRLDYWDLCRIAPSALLLRRYTLALLDRHRWLPLHETSQDGIDWLPAHLPAPVAWGRLDGPRLYLAAEAPADAAAMGAVALRTGRALRVVPVAPEALDRFLAERYPTHDEPESGKGRGWWQKMGKR